MLKRTILKTHFITLAIAVPDYVIGTVFEVSLASQLAVALRMVVALSGVISFFFYLKPFRKINLYFSFYAICFALLIAGVIVRGIFFGIVASIILYPVYPDKVAFKKDDIVIFSSYQGFMGRCCSYRVKEKQFFIAERDYGIFDTDGPVDFEASKIGKVKDGIELTYVVDSFDMEKQAFGKKDTTLLFHK